jgi:hypothetical protein
MKKMRSLPALGRASAESPALTSGIESPALTMGRGHGASGGIKAALEDDNATRWHYLCPSAMARGHLATLQRVTVRVFVMLGIYFVSVKYVFVCIKLMCVCVKFLKI